MTRRLTEHQALLALVLLRGFGPVRSSEFLQTISAEGLCLSEAFRLSPTMRRKRLHLSARLQASLDDVPAALRIARDLERQMAQSGIRWIARSDSQYPQRLTHFMGKSAPLLLFFRGNIRLFEANYFIGIVGTRYPSDRGLAATRRIAAEVARKGVAVVSGGAKGIDIAAHTGALETGTTIFVLPFGLHHLARLRRLEERFSPTNHLIISEFPPFERGTRSTPILRNRTVAALSDALCIAETGTRGGTLHTLLFAHRYSKPLLAFDFAPGKNPPGNASLIATVATAVPVSERQQKSRWRLIQKALRHGTALLKEEPAHQQSLF